MNLFLKGGRSSSQYGKEFLNGFHVPPGTQSRVPSHQLKSEMIPKRTPCAEGELGDLVSQSEFSQDK
jgi:hypothetical protein